MKKIIYFIAFLVIVTGIGGALMILNNSSEPLPAKVKEKAITKILGRKPILTDDTAKGSALYNGKYAQFSYPAGAKIYTYVDPDMKKNTSVLEIFSFDIEDPRMVFSSSVMENSGSLRSISEVPAVMYRQIKTNGYAESEIEAGGRVGLAFERNTNPSEKSGFFLVNNKIYSISATGSSIKEVSILFDDVIKSLVFK